MVCRSKYYVCGSSVFCYDTLVVQLQPLQVDERTSGVREWGTTVANRYGGEEYALNKNNNEEKRKSGVGSGEGTVNIVVFCYLCVFMLIEPNAFYASFKICKVQKKREPKRRIHIYLKKTQR